MSSLKTEVDELRKEWRRKRKGKPGTPKVQNRNNRLLPDVVIPAEEMEEEKEFEEILARIQSKSAEELYEEGRLIMPHRVGSPMRTTLIEILRTAVEFYQSGKRPSQHGMGRFLEVHPQTIARAGMWWKRRGMWPWDIGRNYPPESGAKQKASVYYGVHRQAYNGKWKVAFDYHRRKHYGGTFDNEVDAARACDRLALEVKGDKARLNFPVSTESTNA